ncbi:MAG: DciA family protein [Rikenellaceae bacterium]
MRRTKTMLVGEVFEEFFSRPYVAARIAESKLPDTWRIILGDHVANMTSELRLERNILFAKIESSTIRHELFLQREGLKNEINRISKVWLVNSVIIK